MNIAANYDVIIVGARASGAATAMLLARRGVRVLVVDRARYGTDTLSTHALMRPAVIQLHRWGLIDTVRDSGTPAIRQATFHYPDSSVSVPIAPTDGIEGLYAPRRTVLDRILVDSARAAGATVEFGVIVETLQRDSSGRVRGIVARTDEGTMIAPRSGIVIGADGIRSVVAQAAGAETTREATVDAAVYYGYFENVAASGYEWGYAPGLAAGFIPTNDGAVCVFVGGPTARFRRDVQPDPVRGFHRILGEVSPGMLTRVAASRQIGRLRGFAGVRGYYRKPWGRGWALVGDAGYFRDPITTHGISDAFRDAELLTRAIDGSSSFAEYEWIRDEVTREVFELTGRIASYDWSMDELRSLIRGVSRAMKQETSLLQTLDDSAAA